jgi:hypothetical protein
LNRKEKLRVGGLVPRSPPRECRREHAIKGELGNRMDKRRPNFSLVATSPLHFKRPILRPTHANAVQREEERDTALKYSSKRETLSPIRLQQVQGKLQSKSLF